MTVKVVRTRGGAWDDAPDDEAYDLDATVGFALLWGEQLRIYEVERNCDEGDENAYEVVDGDSTRWKRAVYRVAGFTQNPIAVPHRVRPQGVDEFDYVDDAEDFMLGMIYDQECQNEGHAYAPTRAPLDEDQGGLWSEPYEEDDTEFCIANACGCYLFTDPSMTIVKVASILRGEVIRVFHGDLRYSRAMWWALNGVEAKDEAEADAVLEIQKILAGITGDTTTRDKTRDKTSDATSDATSDKALTVAKAKTASKTEPKAKPVAKPVAKAKEQPVRAVPKPTSKAKAKATSKGKAKPVAKAKVTVTA